MQTMKDKAFQLHVSGYSVFPVGKNKKPLIFSWKKFQTSAPSDEELMELWEKHPEANIGIATGKVSGITVVDVDSYKDGGKTIDDFPKTYTVRTGRGGYHLYYKYHEGITVTTDPVNKVDLRNDGGYVLGAGSVTEFQDTVSNEIVQGEYTVFRDLPLAKFPIEMFENSVKERKEKLIIRNTVSLKEGSRNDTLARLIGSLIYNRKESEWADVLLTADDINKTYSPPLPREEVQTIFDSITKKEKARRKALITSPLQVDDEGGIDVYPHLRKRKDKNGKDLGVILDMSNALIVLRTHPLFKTSIRYNSFKNVPEFRGKEMEESDTLAILEIMQRDCHLPGLPAKHVEDAVRVFAQEHKYDEAVDWLTSLVWDGTPRLEGWTVDALNAEDTEYHRAVGANWIMGMVSRIMEPGCQFDYVLLLLGKQNIGKSSVFKIIGGPWHKMCAGDIGSKDFYLKMRGCMLMDFDEATVLYKASAMHVKSTITEREDEYRAPYDKVTKKFLRRNVFSMSANDLEPLKDVTGNRRYWPVHLKKVVNFKWLEDNRDQLFAEAYSYWVNKTKILKVPVDEALEKQRDAQVLDDWTDEIMHTLQQDPLYCAGNREEFETTIADLYMNTFPDAKIENLDPRKSQRITSILKLTAGLEPARTDSRRYWRFTPERAEELQKSNLKSTKDPLQAEFDKND